MKTFEERFTAWVDGELKDGALADFERELAGHPEAAAEREAAVKLRSFLRTHPTAPQLSNPDFFNLQLQQRLEAETPRPAKRSESRFAWSLARLAWAAAFCLIVAGVLFQTTIPTTPPNAPSNYFAQVVESWPADPTIFATTVYNADSNVTVLWLDGLDYIPGSTQLQ
jgi:anti-sigma factor RsiW